MYNSVQEQDLLQSSLKKVLSERMFSQVEYYQENYLIVVVKENMVQNCIL